MCLDDGRSITWITDFHHGLLAYGQTIHEEWLVAYFTSHLSISTLSLRRFLKERLPERMIPAHFHRLEALPRTPAGKLDRARLPKPDAARTESGTVFVAPRTSTERTIAAIWQQALKVERVGIHDNFLDLGGHSLMAISVVDEMLKQLLGKLKVRISPTRLFVNTLAQLAASCELQMERVQPGGDGDGHGMQ